MQGTAVMTATAAASNLDGFELRQFAKGLVDDVAVGVVKVDLLEAVQCKDGRREATVEVPPSRIEGHVERTECSQLRELCGEVNQSVERDV
jgi:hypothetical protein